MSTASTDPSDYTPRTYSTGTAEIRVLPPSIAERPGDHRPGGRAYRRLLLALFATGVATFAQLYSPQGVLVSIADGLEISPASAASLVSASTAGLAISVLPWSLVGDRIGRVTALRWSMGAALLFALLLPLLDSFPLLFLCRVLEGAALGGVPVLAVAYLTEQVDPDVAAVANGAFISGNTIGGLIGRLLAAPVGQFLGWQAGLLAVALLCLAASVVFFLVAPPERHPRRIHRSVAKTFGSAWRHLRTGSMAILFAQGFLLMGAFVAVYNYLAFRLEEPPFSMPASLASLLFLSYLFGTVSSRVAGRLAARFGRYPVMIVAGIVMAAGIIVTLSDHLVLVLVGLCVVTTGMFGGHSIASGWVGARAVKGRSQATAMYTALYYIGSSLIGWLAGFVWNSAGWSGVVLLLAPIVLLAPVIALLCRPLREANRVEIARARV